MKARLFLVQLILIFVLISCKKNEIIPVEEGITFRQYKIESSGNTNTSFSIVQYDEILGYDSTKCAFVLNESAWKRIEKEVGPVVPDPNFGFFVALNNEFIYAAGYIQLYSSFARRDIITFIVKKPNIIFMELGYPAVPENEFTGKNSRNDSRLINRLKEDNKLIELKN